MEQGFRVFEKSVAELLSLAGFQIQQEQIVLHKKVDLLAHEWRLGKLRRIAVECKDHSRALSQKEVSEILASYFPLQQNHLVDEILLVTAAGLAPSAFTMVAETRELNHLTFKELQNQIMDFHSYLLALMAMFDAKGLSEYYIPSRIRDGGAVLEDEVLSWVRTDWNKEPLAILGSYGMGKTSFALRLGNVLAKMALHDSQDRIPVYIRLNEISAEQSLEGLLGKALTATHLVRGYSFHAFMKLNELGRFVIILDGFDEMKHALSWDELKFNFRQINRLVCGASKVLVLGRPTVFLSEEEQRYVLRGIRVHFGQEIQEPDRPVYRELYLAPFNGREIEAFLHRYFDYKKRGGDSTSVKDHYPYLNKSINSKITALSSGRGLYDIASRPVQLQMIAEVLPQWKGSIDDMTVAILYSRFIDRIIEREYDKLERKRFDTALRRRFARSVAWWLWIRGHSSGSASGLPAAEIPDHILTPFLATDMDREAVLRDLVAACFLERKAGDSLYFPHRSFQEFLVAEEMVEWIKSPEGSIEAADKHSTVEVGNFMSGIAGESDLAGWERNLKLHRGQISYGLARAWTGPGSRLSWLEARAEESGVPWYLIFLTTCGIENERYAENVLGKIRSLQSKTDNALYCLLSHLCSMFLLPHVPSHKRNGRYFASVLGQSLFECCRVALGGSWAAIRREKRDTPEAYLARLMESTKKKGLGANPVVMQFMVKIIIGATKEVADIGGTYRVLCTVLRDYCLLTSWIAGSTLRVSGAANISTVSFSSEEFWHGADVPNPMHFKMVEQFIEKFS
jgi:hypothetical protein